MSCEKSLIKYRPLGDDILEENVEREEGESGLKGERRRNTGQQASQYGNPWEKQNNNNNNNVIL